MGKRANYQKNKRSPRKNNRPRKGKSKSNFKFLLLGLFISITIVGIIVFKFIEPQAEAQVSQADPVVNQIAEAHSDKVSIERNGDIVIKPTNDNAYKGLVLYPEKDVAQDAYLPLGTLLAEKGYLVVIPKFFFNNPSLDGNKVKSIIDQNSAIDVWVVGGHGEGGTFASKSLSNSPKIKGAFFLASYPDESINLVDSPLKVYSVIGSADDTVSLDVWKQKKSQLPNNTVYTIIQDGNHSYYGNYKEENTGISKKEQQIQTVVQLVNLLDEAR